MDRARRPGLQPDKPPSYRPPEGASGPDALSGTDAFIMQADGKGWLYTPAGMVDGPLPTHYEPQESPVVNPLYPGSSATRPGRSDQRLRTTRSTPSGTSPAPPSSRTCSPPTG